MAPRNRPPKPSFEEQVRAMRGKDQLEVARKFAEYVETNDPRVALSEAVRLNEDARQRGNRGAEIQHLGYQDISRLRLQPAQQPGVDPDVARWDAEAAADESYDPDADEDESQAAVDDFSDELEDTRAAAL
jgi:hypothetical protein